MQPALAQRAGPHLKLRPATPADVDALLRLEQRAFRGDRISHRGFRQFVASPRAALIVAEEDGVIAGYALVLFRERSGIARLYSIAVSPQCSGRGLGPALLTAAEQAALDRDRVAMRLEVHEHNAKAIARYRKAGYTLFGRHAQYYADRGHALRFEKRLTPRLRRLEHAPPYFHQSTEFTCGPACVMMAMAWADPSLRPNPELEFRLWRESTTIFLSSGHGGCEPYGLAVTLRRHGLFPEIHVSAPPPYFLDTVRSEDKRRVMRLTQKAFQREAEALGIPTRLAPIGESGLIRAFDSGASAIVLVAGYRMLRRRVPHWVFAFGHEERYILVHDPAAERDQNGARIAAETYAVPRSLFAQMTHFGGDNLNATILIRKGPLQ